MSDFQTQLQQIQDQQIQDPKSPTFQLVSLVVFDFIHSNLPDERRHEFEHKTRTHEIDELLEYAREHIEDFDLRVQLRISEELHHIHQNAAEKLKTGGIRAQA